MIYRLIVKDKTKQPAKGKYNDWKEIVAKECFNQCIYCAIGENQWGGLDNFHVEHFRPKSIKEFADLTDDITNLYLACSVCNRFKNDDWPGDPDLTLPTYADPSITDYSQILDMCMKSFGLNGNCVSARYMIQKLYLNRPQLLNERKEWALDQKEQALRSEIMDLLRQHDDFTDIKKGLEHMDEIKNLADQRKQISNYKLSEIRREK